MATLNVTFFVYHANKYNRDGVKTGVESVTVDAYRWLPVSPEMRDWVRVGGGQTDNGGMFTFNISQMGGGEYVPPPETFLFRFSRNMFNPEQFEQTYDWNKSYYEEIALIQPGWEGKPETPEVEPEKPKPTAFLPFSTKDLFMLGIMVAFGALVKSLKK